MSFQDSFTLRENVLTQEKLTSIQAAIEKGNENALFWKVLGVFGTVAGVAAAGVTAYYGIQSTTVQTIIQNSANSNISVIINDDSKRMLQRAVEKST